MGRLVKLLAGVLTIWLCTTIFSPSAFAQVPMTLQQAQAFINTLRFVDSATISGTLPDGTVVTFVDNDPFPADTVFNYVSSSSSLCTVPNQSGDENEITFSAAGWASGTANVQINYYVPGRVPPPECANVADTTETIENLPARDIEFERISATQIRSLANGSTFTLYTGSSTYLESASQPCLGAVVTSSQTSGVEYQPGIGGSTVTILGTTCNNMRANNVTIRAAGAGGGAPCDPRTGPPSATCICTPTGPPGQQNCTPTGGNNGAGGNGGAQEETCEFAWRDGLEWLICSAIRSTDRFLHWLIGTIERQLFFDRDAYLTTDVYRAWSVFRNIAAGLLVIIMLIMVLSQAMSWGPFDAYTVRRMMPRLVAAAILIPLSWSLLYFVIGLFNNLGQGIANIMFYPFGGEANMTLQNLLDVDLNADENTLFLGLTITAGVLAVAIAPFAALAMAWLVVPAVLIGFFVLALREILLIAAVMLAPIAIILWILPGTKKFWNLWQETLEKLLIMFPLIMALIATGRIFAYIAKGTEREELAIINFMLILIGVFGPLILLPKTFSWGGQLLGQLTGAVNNRSKGVFDRPRGFLQGRQKMQNEKRDVYNAQRSAGRRPYTRGPMGWVQRGVVKAKSGQLDPTLRMAGGREAVARKETEFLAKVPRAMNEAVQNEKLRLQLELDGLDRSQILERLREYSTDANSSEDRIRASAEMMRDQKDTQGLKHMQRELAGQGRGQLWNSIKNANFGDFRKLSPDLVEDWTDSGGSRATIQTRGGAVDAPITFAPLQDKLNALAAAGPAGSAAHQRMTDDLLRGFRAMDDEQKAGLSANAWHETLTISRAAGSTEAHDALDRIAHNDNLTISSEVRTHYDTGTPLQGGTPITSHNPYDRDRPFNNPRDEDPVTRRPRNPNTPTDYV